MKLEDLIPALKSEMKFGFDHYGKYHTAHEHYAVLLEEVDEWWLAIKGNVAELSHYELLQISAVAIRYILENGDIDVINESQRYRHKK
jgi:hypothetical protein